MLLFVVTAVSPALCFVHDLREVYKTALCVKWQLGRCAVGNLCRHAVGAHYLSSSNDREEGNRAMISIEIAAAAAVAAAAADAVFNFAVVCLWSSPQHGPEEMRGVVVPAGTSPKKGAADATTAGVAAATAGVASPSGMGRLANPGGRRSDPPEADLSSRSSLGSSSGNTSSSSNSTCTSSPAPCHSPYSFSGASGRGVDSGAAAPAIDGAAKETEHERAVSELQQALPDFGETPRGSHLQQQTDYQAQHQPQSHQQQGFGNYLAGPFALQGGNLGAPWAPEGGAFPLDYPLQPQSAAGWEAQQQQQQQQGRSLGQHGKALMQPRHLPSQKSAALPAPSRKLPKAVQRQMRQQQVQQQQQLQQHQQQLLLLQPQRQARPTSQKDLQQQQQPQNQQLQAGQGGHRRRCTQQQQQQQQNQQLQSQQQLCPWVPRHQRLPWGGVQHQQQQQRHQQPQLPLQGSFHTQAQQHHVPQETMLLLQQQQQQQQANLPLHEGQWEQQEQQHPHPLAQYRPLSDRALTTDPSHPLLQPLQQQQQQTKAASCGPQLPQQQQQQQHTWEPERLLSLWEQADVCCWTGGSGAQEHQDDTAAAVSAAAAFVDAPMSDRLLLLSHQDVEGPGTGALPQQELQLESLEAGGEAAGAGGAAATDGKAQFPPAVSSAATGIPRPVPLQAPDCSRISQTSEESPCSILFSGPKLFNVAADADSQH